MLSIKNKTVLITGPTSGIGRDLVELFARDGATLILVSRNLKKLELIKKEVERKYLITAYCIPSDLSRSGAADQLIAAIKSANLTIDILVNNAGFGVYGVFHEESIEDQLRMIELHITAPTRLTHAFLPGMLKKNDGGILNVSSTGGFQPVPLENVYCSTKAYLTHFTEALFEEVRGSNVHIHCLCPGPTETAFFDQPLMKTRTPAKLPRMKSIDVALQGYQAFKKGKALSVTGAFNKFMVLGTKFAPRRVVCKVAKKIVEKTLSKQ